MHTALNRTRLADRFAVLLPRIELEPNAFQARHRMLGLVLWLHIAVVLVAAALTTHWGSSSGEMAGMGGTGGTGGMADETALPFLPVLVPDLHLAMQVLFIAGAIACALAMQSLRSQRAGALCVAVGLLLCANALVHVSGGQTDMHFDYFVVLALISLYQDWIVFAVAVLTVAVHHALLATMAPEMVFSSPQARANPLQYAVLHTGFVLAMSAGQITYWRYAHSADQALRRSAEEAHRLALVARYTDNAVVLTDRQGRIEWVNDAFSRMTGYSLDEALGQTRLSLFHGPDAELARLRTLLEHPGRSIDAEFATSTRAGREYWLNLEVRPITTNGEVTRLLGIERDVTSRHNSEEQERLASRRAAALADELKAEKSLLAGVIEAIPHLVYWRDAAGELAGANEAFARYTGNAAFAETLQAVEAEVAATGAPVIDRQIAVAVEAGRPVTLLVSVLPNGRGAAAGLIGVGADITHVAALEQQLSQAHRLESVGQLAAGIAHEINTPVQFVSDNTRFVADSFASLLPTMTALSELVGVGAPAAGGAPVVVDCEQVRSVMKGVDLLFLAAEVPAALAETMEGLERVAQIVRAMKDFSHPGQASAAADLNRAIESTAQVCRNEWKYIATMDLDLDPALGLVECHEGEIKQTVLNMIVNGAHAIDERRTNTGDTELGRITVRTRRDGDAMRIEISDDGQGMDQVTQQRIFDPFFTTKQVGKGTGQGLSLAHATVVGKHGGTIAVVSTPGRGTTFTITLPVRAGAEEAE